MAIPVQPKLVFRFGLVCRSFCPWIDSVQVWFTYLKTSMTQTRGSFASNIVLKKHSSSHPIFRILQNQPIHHLTPKSSTTTPTPLASWPRTKTLSAHTIIIQWPLAMQPCWQIRVSCNRNGRQPFCSAFAKRNGGRGVTRSRVFFVCWILFSILC